MRVLYVQSTSEIGGSDVALLRMVEALDPGRYRAHAALPQDGPLVPALRRAGCRVHFVPAMLQLTGRHGVGHLARYAAAYLEAVRALARLIRTERIDLVHTNSLHNWHGFAAASISGRPHVWHAREIATQGRAVSAFERVLARRCCDRLIAASGAVGRQFSDSARGLPAHLRAIPDSVDLERFHPRVDGRRIREELGPPPEAPVAAVVGRLEAGKGVDVFLRAAALCRRGFPGARFLVVGGAAGGREAYAAELRRLAVSLGLEGAVEPGGRASPPRLGKCGSRGDAVHFTGWRYGPERMPEVYAALDVLVVASRRPEGFGLSALEAMASGKPVVATRHGGPAEICVHGETALLIPPDDPERMAEALGALLGDPAAARALGAAGRRRAEARYDRRRVARSLETLYDEVLAERQGISPPRSARRTAAASA